MSAETRRVIRAWLAPKLWGLHLLLVAAVVFTTVMGLWQLGVYDARQASAQAEGGPVQAVELSEVLGPDEAFNESANEQPVRVRGRYAPAEDQIWVSGRKHGGRDGYWLVAPFLVEGVPKDEAGRDAALLVVRGWSPDNRELRPVPDGEIRLRAVLMPGEASTGTGLGADRTVDSVRIPTLVGKLGYDLYSGFGIVTEQQPSGAADLAAVAPPAPETTWTVGWRNLVYAIQWWVFGAFAVFMWWRMSSDLTEKDAGRAGRAGDPEGAGGAGNATSQAVS